jgi:hypothetical protein
VTAEDLARLLHQLSAERLASWEEEARATGRVTGADHFDATGWDERPADSNRCAVEEAQAILDRLAREGWTVQRLPSATCRAPYCLDAIPGMRCPTCPERRDG